MGSRGLEPRTSSLSGTRSNQLSYEPEEQVAGGESIAVARLAVNDGPRDAGVLNRGVSQRWSIVGSVGGGQRSRAASVSRWALSSSPTARQGGRALRARSAAVRRLARGGLPHSQANSSTW